MFRLFAVTERNPCMRCGPSPFLNAYIFAVKVSTIMAKRLLTILLLSTAAMLASQAQNADGRIGTCMNEGRWFDLAHELNVTPADSVNPILYKMAVAMTHHYFNRPDSACTVLGDLLNNHQEELGDNTLSMAVLMGMNLARTDRYAEAADLMQSLCGQLGAYRPLCGSGRSDAEPVRPAGSNGCGQYADRRAEYHGAAVPRFRRKRPCLPASASRRHLPRSDED